MESTKRFVKVKSGKVIDTTLLLPHVECYQKDKENKLYVEYTMDGSTQYLGTIVAEANTIEELVEK